MSTVPPLTPIAPATSSPRISGIPPAKLTTRAEVRRFEAVKRLPWLRLGDAAGLTGEEMWEERHVVPGVRFAVDAYVTFARTRPWVEAVDYRKELTTEEWQRVLTGDAARRDPVCHLSPDHQIVADAVRAANEEPGKADFVPRVRTVHRG